MSCAAACPIDPALVAAAVRQEIAGLERFLDRRLAELSAELYSATRIAESSEDNITRELRALHAQVEGLVAPPDPATINSGPELAAVLDTTEAAANQIMEAAEAIADAVRAELPPAEGARVIAAAVDRIFEACAFQDLTGQRVRRAIDHLHHVGSVMAGLVAAPGTPAPERRPAPAPTVASGGADIDQAAVDALFA